MIPEEFEKLVFVRPISLAFSFIKSEKSTEPLSLKADPWSFLTPVNLSSSRYILPKIVFSVLLFRNYFKTKLPSLNFYKVLVLIILFLMINIGFAFFTANIGNAIRHKTVTFFIVFLMLPFFYVLFEELISKFSIKKFYHNYNQRR